MKSYDDKDVDHILILVLNDEVMARKIAKWLDVSYLVDYMQATSWQRVIWIALRQLLESSETEFPTKEYIARTASNEALRAYGDEALAATAADSVIAMSDITPMFDMANERLTYLYTTCVQNPNIQAAVADMSMNSDISELLDRVHQLRDDNMSALAVSEDKQQLDAFSILDNLESEDGMAAAEAEAENARIFTGVPYIDTLLGGKGLYKGYVTMVLGPSGGGKTITGCELAAQLTAQGKSVGMFGTEENAHISVEMRARLFAAASEVSVSDWMSAGCHPNKLRDTLPNTPEHAAIIKCMRNMRERLSIYDLSEGVSWNAIISKVENHFANSGSMHDVVIIDWAGPLAEAMTVEGEASSMHEALERVVMWSLQQIAVRYQCGLVLFHQLSTSAQAKKGVFGNYTMYDSQNCTKMAHHCAAVQIISPRDKLDRARYISAKARFDVPGEVVNKMDYDHTRFHMQDHVSVQGNRFQDSSRKSDNSKKMMHKDSGRDSHLRSET